MCNDLGLKEFLIYVCNESNDFVTPINKLLPSEINDEVNKDPSSIAIIEYFRLCL